MIEQPTFYFFNDRTAIRFHIKRQLLALGWEVGPEKKACFTDRHLTLNDDISKHLEYKHLLAQLVQSYCPEVMPITYCINDSNAQEIFAKMVYEHYMPEGRYLSDRKLVQWILKPSTLNNGDYIKLFNNVEELKKHYSQPNRLGGEHVIQQYIAEPALIEGKKYTFRLPMIITNYAGVFLYNQGYINICALPFSNEDRFAHRKAHISNYVLDGEFSYIEQRSTQTLENFTVIYAQMITILRKVIQGLLRQFPAYVKPQALKIFEIFGCDFTLDAKGKVWLLEINQGPDAPTFEENVLSEILWKNFWQDDIIGDFVLPIALGASPRKQYGNFTQLLKAKESYSVWRCFFKKFL